MQDFPQPRNRSDRRAGAILIAVGIGIGIHLSAEGETSRRHIGPQKTPPQPVAGQGGIRLNPVTDLTGRGGSGIGGGQGQVGGGGYRGHGGQVGTHLQGLPGLQLNIKSRAYKCGQSRAGGSDISTGQGQDGIGLNCGNRHGIGANPQAVSGFDLG